MDENFVTHELWMNGSHVFNYCDKTEKVQYLYTSKWTHGTYTVSGLAAVGYEVRPINIDLENK